MSNPYFRFKQFTVWHDKCAMKVGTDGVLLGAWTKINGARRILDIGAGTGLVSLMLAQRSTLDTRIVGVEIDQLACEQALENILRSPWKERIEIRCVDFVEYSTTEKFDLIVSNPPFFVDSLTCPNHQRNVARHNGSLHYDILLKRVAELLNIKGSFYIILPADISDTVCEMAAIYGLHANSRLNIITKPNATPKRCIICFKFQSEPCKNDDLLIEISRHKYSEAYIALTKAYYLNF